MNLNHNLGRNYCDCHLLVVEIRNRFLASEMLCHTAEVFGKKHLKFQFGPKHNSTEVIAWNGEKWFEWMGNKADLAISPTVYGKNIREQRIQYQAVGIKPTK